MRAKFTTRSQKTKTKKPRSGPSLGKVASSFSAHDVIGQFLYSPQKTEETTLYLFYEW